MITSGNGFVDTFGLQLPLAHEIPKDPDEKHNVIKMTEHFYFRGHLCIAMELLSINLYELIKANGFVGFTTGLIRRFTSQMLMSLSLMRHHRIVHCDLKPEVFYPPLFLRCPVLIAHRMCCSSILQKVPLK